MGKVESSDSTVTEQCRLYYYKLKNEKYISIIDTPGIPDYEHQRKREEHFNFELIINFLSEAGIQVKGLIYLVDYKTERFPIDEENYLLSLNTYFPFKSFWKQILVILSHFYSEHEVDKNFIFSKIMNKQKDVSDVIDYNEIKIKYFNCSFPVRKEYQKKKNNIIRKELVEELNKFILMKPLFFKIAIDFNKAIYLDSEGKPIANIENIKNYSTNISTKNNKNCLSF